MKRILGIILTICMLLSILPTNVFAATELKVVHAKVTDPAVGKKPENVVLTGDTRFEVKETRWSGNLNDDGTFKVGEVYTVEYDVNFINYKDVIKYRLVITEGIDVTLNGYKAKIIYKDNSKFATLSYTFPILTETGVADDPDRVLAGVEYKLSSNTAKTQPDQVFAEEPSELRDRLDFNIQTPVAGESPLTQASTVHPEIEIIKVTWEGVFTPDKKYMAGNTYKTHIYFRIKGSVNKILPNAAGNRKASLNGEAAAYSLNKDDKKMGCLIASFTAPMPKTYLNVGWIYSKEEADSLRYPVNKKLHVLKSLSEANEMKLYSQVDAVEDITHIIVDSDDKISGAFMEELHNLQEVWLSSKVDAKYFIDTYASAGPAFQRIYAWESNGAKTWDLKVYVPKESLPNGLMSEYPLAARSLWFETVLYEGDVYEAYEKKQAGQDVKIPWCTNHEYTYPLTTADRVMIERDCFHSRWFCYSCIHCGKPEYNINHIFSVNDNNPPDVLTDTIGRTFHDYRYETSEIITAATFVGMNADGEYVYQKTCEICGTNAYNDYTCEYMRGTHLNFNEEYDDFEYEWYVEQMKNDWQKTILPQGIAQTTSTHDSSYFFATPIAPVSAKFSSWAENELNAAKQEGILDEALLGSDYTIGINRLQFCSLAVKMAENMLNSEITPAPSGTFADTDDIYVRKAYAAGITSGTGNGQFSPYAILNRQQMATFVYRALQYVRNNSGIRYTVYTPELEKYSDNWAIQDWARESLGFMNALGLVKGVSDTAINPDGNCTVEQAILVAYRSLSADEIGWYQKVPDTENTKGGYYREGGPSNYLLWPYVSSGNHFLTQATVEGGDRVWVTNYIDADGLTEGFLEVEHPYVAGHTVYLDAQNFKAIKDLSAEDLVLYNKSNGK